MHGDRDSIPAVRGTVLAVVAQLMATLLFIMMNQDPELRLSCSKCLSVKLMVPSLTSPFDTTWCYNTLSSSTAGLP